MYNPILLDYSSKCETLDIHYNKIYKELLATLNKLLSDNGYKFDNSLRYLVDNIDMFPLKVRGEILYYLGAVLNHNLYFYNISDKKNNLPIGKIKDDINKEFGNFDNFKRNFIDVALNLKGSGYTFLVRDRKKELKIINTSNEDTPYSYNLIPIISLDLWEHAYFPKYKDDREKYIEDFFDIIDFEKINKYYEKL